MHVLTKVQASYSCQIKFTGPQVYDSSSGQIEIFDVTAKPIIDSVMEGYNGTIFAYGQVIGLFTETHSSWNA